MDLVKIGEYLRELRKEKGYTQEQLGEILGTTNKTISRWETGVYLPPVEMLQLLSDLYGISINEILSGERLSNEQFKAKAEENIKSALDNSVFTTKDKIRYFKRKWLKEHAFSLSLFIVGIIVLTVVGIIFDNGLYFVATIGGIAGSVYFNNAKMSYVEYHVYEDKQARNREDE